MRTALHQVFDPEIGLDIMTMGLVYRLEGGMEKVLIDMTLTTPGCPVSDSLPEEARQAAARVLSTPAATNGSTSRSSGIRRGARR